LILFFLNNVQTASLNVKTITFHCKQIKVSACLIANCQISLTNQFVISIYLCAFSILLCTNEMQGGNVLPCKFVDVVSPSRWRIALTDLSALSLKWLLFIHLFITKSYNNEINANPEKSVTMGMNALCPKLAINILHNDMWTMVVFIVLKNVG